MDTLTTPINITSSAIRNIVNSEATEAGSRKIGDSGTFDAVFAQAANLISGTNNYLQQAAQAEVAYATGELTSTHELAVIEQKANLSLQYTVAIKNQLLSAYKEIMNMQI